MAFITVNANESIESALRRFKRKVISEEIIKDLKKHAHFIPPGQKAKLKSANARKRNRRRFRQQRPMNAGGGSGQGRPSGPGGGAGAGTGSTQNR
jgi:small subunit ribosomal protein S21